MDETLYKRVRSAAIAGWWTLLIAAGFLLLQWLAYLAIMSARPEWMLRWWGSGITWGGIQDIWLWSVAIFKVCVWVLAMVVVWLTIWARLLKRD